MSILIQDMEMPKQCGTCFLRVGDCKQRMYMEQRPKGCPLVELPPHGDLVDLSDTVHPNDSMRRMTIDEQLRRTCEGWSADRKQYVVIEAEGET